MESPQLKIQPKVEQLASKTSTRLPDKQQLLLLGLQLLNKGLKLPTAVVQPQVQRQTATKQTPPSPPSVTQLKKPSPLPNSPVKSVSSDDESDKEEGVRSPTVVIGRKRKRNSNDDLSEVEKREKRYVVNIDIDLTIIIVVMLQSYDAVINMLNFFCSFSRFYQHSFKLLL